MQRPFARRRFPPAIILLCVRWYCKYGFGYRDLGEMMEERGISVDHTTLFRWVQRYAPEIEKRTRWFRGTRSTSWRVDETYSKVAGKWRYLFRAIDSRGQLIDFRLLEKRNTHAAYRFLKQAIKTAGTLRPDRIVTDKNGAYPKAIARLKRENLFQTDAIHRTTKYMNDGIEADHGALKQAIDPTRGFKTLPTAGATIKGFETMRMIRRGHRNLVEPGTRGEAGFIGDLFDVAA